MEGQAEKENINLFHLFFYNNGRCPLKPIGPMLCPGLVFKPAALLSNYTLA